MASLGNLLVAVGADLSAFNASMGEIGDRMKDAESQASSAWSGLESLGGRLMGVGATLSAALTLPLAGIGAEAIKVGESLNIAEMAFTTMLGSGEKAKTFLDGLKQFAATTPFEFPDLVEASKRMLAMGFSADKVIPTLRTIGDAVAAVGGGKDVINGVTLALGQMQAKGKVSAQEMNQLAERGIPAWQFLADQIGVSIPEAMKLAETGALKSSEAIPAILAGMNDKFGGQMTQMSSTLTGVWSNFKDQLTMTLGDVGKTLTPILTQLLQAAMPLLDWVKSAAEWFAQLPEPARNAGLAFAAIAAAAGPLLLTAGGVITAVSTLGAALGPIAAGLGIGTTAMLGWAAAIPVATAALVALGTWVYDNWDGIKAVVGQAWDGLAEMWTAAWAPISGVLTTAWGSISGAADSVWGPVAGFFSTIWDSVGPYFTSAWNGIASTVTGIWTAIQATASAVWGGIVSVFQTFLEWAAKIPGANKLMNLDEAWASAKKHAAAMKESADATAKHKAETDKLGKAHGRQSGAAGKASDATDKLGKAHKDTATHAETLTKKSELLFAMSQKLKQEHDKHVKALADLTLKYGDVANRIPQLIQPTDDLNASVQALVSNVKTVAPSWTTAIDTTSAELAAALQPVRDLDAAYKTLGITGTKAAQDHADAAQAAYETIKNSGTASAADITAAWAKAQTAQIDAAKAAGKITAEEAEKALAEVKSKTDTGLGKVTDSWKGWGGEISGLITNLTGGLNGKLWEGTGSFKDKGTAALVSLGKDVATHFSGPLAKEAGTLMDGVLKDLMGGKGFGGLTDRLVSFGESVLQHFLAPVQKAGTDLITGCFSDLIGGKGFGGLEDAAKKAGKTISDTFGGAGTTIPGTTPGTGGGGGGTGPGGGGGGGGGGTGGADGVMGLVNMISGVVTAIASVGQWIMAIRQEGTLNGIEHNTRYSMMFLGERADGGILGVLFRVQENTQFVQGQLDGLNAKLIDWLSPVPEALAGLNDAMQWALKRFDQIGNDVMYGSAADKAQQDILGDIRDALRNDPSTPLLEQIAANTAGLRGGATPPAAGIDVARMRLQGVLA